MHNIPFLRLLDIAWSKAFVYRADLIMYTLASIATPLVALAVWYAIANAGGSIADQQFIVTYYILAMFVELVTRSWRGIYLVQYILDGKIVMYLIRPPAIWWDYVTSNIATKIVQLSLPVPLFILAAALFPRLFHSAIYEPVHIALFFVSLLLAAAMHFFLDIAIGLLAFWIDDANQLHGYRFLLMQISSGILIPFVMMPDWLQRAFSLLPFRYIISAPIEVLLGTTSGTGVISLIAIQGIWLLGLAGLARFLFVRGVRRYSVPGQ